MTASPSTSERSEPTTRLDPPFPVTAFAVPPKGVNDSYSHERDGMIDEALSIATGLIGGDRQVIESRARRDALVDRVKKAVEIAQHVDDGNLWLDIDSEAGTLAIAVAYAVTRGWLWDRAPSRSTAKP